MTHEGYEGLGYGRLLINVVRRWTKRGGYTVETVGVLEESYGF